MQLQRPPRMTRNNAEGSPGLRGLRGEWSGFVLEGPAEGRGEKLIRTHEISGSTANP
jgi:hypothetical protein